MDERTMLLRLMRSEFGNLKSVPRIKTVTVGTVDLTNKVATVTYATDPDDTDPPDPQDVSWIEGYFPITGETAYLANIEGHPILLGSEYANDWTSLTLPSGYTSVSPFRAPSYRMDHQGRVWFRGCCNVAASNAIGTKFTMPAPYRPLAKTYIVAWVSNGTAIQNTFPGMRYDVGTNGVIETLVASPAATQFFSFEGVSYDTRP